MNMCVWCTNVCKCVVCFFVYGISVQSWELVNVCVYTVNV